MPNEVSSLIMLAALDVEMRPVDAGDGYANPTCKDAPSGGDPVTRTETFSVYLPTQATSAVDFGLLVDVSGSHRCSGEMENPFLKC